MRQYKVVLPIYFIKNKKKQEKVLMGLNWYTNAHFAQKSNAKKFIAELIEYELGGNPLLTPPIHIHYDVYVKRADTDGGNIRSVMEKFALDALQTSNIIPEDRFDVVVSDSSKYYQDKEYPRIEIIIKEITI